MIISTLLLSQNDMYVDDKGNLPKRPTFDKELLKAICTDEYVTDEGYNMLPPSIASHTKFADTLFDEPTVGITIPEIGALTDLLIVSRSNKIIENGKQFRFDKFKLIVKQPELEIWRRI